MPIHIIECFKLLFFSCYSISIRKKLKCFILSDCYKNRVTYWCKISIVMPNTVSVHCPDRKLHDINMNCKQKTVMTILWGRRTYISSFFAWRSCYPRKGNQAGAGAGAGATGTISIWRGGGMATPSSAPSSAACTSRFDLRLNQTATTFPAAISTKSNAIKM